jgi:hypothetical protein
MDPPSQRLPITTLSRPKTHVVEIARLIAAGVPTPLPTLVWPSDGVQKLRHQISGSVTYFACEAVRTEAGLISLPSGRTTLPLLMGQLSITSKSATGADFSGG